MGRTSTIDLGSHHNMNAKQLEKKIQEQVLETSRLVRSLPTMVPELTPASDISSLCRGTTVPDAEFATAAMSLSASISNLLYSKSKSTTEINTRNRLHNSARDARRSHRKEVEDGELMDHNMFVRRDQWIPHSERKSCGFCARDFNVLFRTKHSCHMCGDVVCSRCSVFKLVNLPIGECKARVCSRCLLIYRQQVHSTEDHDRHQMNHSPHDKKSHGYHNSPSSELINMDANTSEQYEWYTHDELTPKRSQLLSDNVATKNRKTLRNPRRLSTFTAQIPVVLLSPSASRDLRMTKRHLTNRSSMPGRRGDDLSYSFASTVSSSVCSRTMIYEEGKLHTNELQREVLRSRERIEELEKRMQEQESHKIINSKRQQLQLQEAQLMIEALQQQLAEQQLVERDAILERNPIILSNQRQPSSFNISPSGSTPPMTGVARRMTDPNTVENGTIGSRYELEQALKLVLSSIPVDIACMNAEDIQSLETPSGLFISAELASRLRQITALHLLRISPTTILRMHPCVIERYQTTGMTILEKRALYTALSSVASVWDEHEQDEEFKRKAMWFRKLEDGLLSSLSEYQKHDLMCSHLNMTSSVLPRCPLIGKSCPLRLEAAITELYGAGFGFPYNGFAQQEIVKSDAEGINEKAIYTKQEQPSMVIQQQQELRSHYDPTPLREVTLTNQTLEEIETTLERIYALDHTFFDLWECHLKAKDDRIEARAERERVWEVIVVETYTLVQLLDCQADMPLMGKENSGDENNTSSNVEDKIVLHALTYLLSLVDDLQSVSTHIDPSGSHPLLTRITELIQVLERNNADLLKFEMDLSQAGIRVRWKNRLNDGSSTLCAVDEQSSVPIQSPCPTVLPQSYLLLEAIRAKRARTSRSNSEVTQTTYENGIREFEF